MAIKTFYITGLVNDIIEKIETQQPTVLKKFLDLNGIRREDAAGGKFNGPSVKTILRRLDELGAALGEEGQDIIQYLVALREVYIVCVSKNLDPQYMEVIKIWHREFDNLHHTINLSMTIKAHVFYHHLEEFFDHEGVTLHTCSGEGVEATHARFKRHKYERRMKVHKRTGTEVHLKRHNSSVVGYNSSRFGFSD